MSVRPITQGEQKFAHGEPMTTLLMTFGAMHGFLTHLRLNNLNLRSLSYTPTPFAKLTLLPCIGGMMCIGHTTAIYFFSDDGLRRLHLAHLADRKVGVDNTKYAPRQN